MCRSSAALRGLVTRPVQREAVLSVLLCGEAPGPSRSCLIVGAAAGSDGGRMVVLAALGEPETSWPTALPEAPDPLPEALVRD